MSIARPVARFDDGADEEFVVGEEGVFAGSGRLEDDGEEERDDEGELDGGSDGWSGCGTVQL